jgi:glycerol-3-phosphate dehydrogenase (NAD(P)+)
VADIEIAIMGAGAFGTAMAIAQAAGGQRVGLWARNPERAEALRHAGENRAHLPGHALPPGCHVTSQAGDLAAARAVLLCVPTQQLRPFLQAHGAALGGGVLVLCCKGVELGTGFLPSEVVQDCAPDAQVAVLTGPSFATDIAAGKPTALTLATRAPEADALQQLLSAPALRLYLSDDLAGAQLGGALKNVVAIACGVAMGAGLGESARAALMTRGFAEIVRMATHRGARPETLWGLSGFGDLVLTATSAKSRNYTFGLSVGAGAGAPEAGKTIEGIATARALAGAAGADDLPVTRMVDALVTGQITLREAVDALLARPLKRE